MTGIDNRKDLLLLLLYMAGGSERSCEPIRGRTRLMKLLFLLDKQQDIPKALGIRNWYDFEPYDFGPFTHEVFNDVEFLRNVGLIQGTTEGAQSVAESKEAQRVAEEAEGDYPTDFGGMELPEEEFRLSAKGEAFVERKLLAYLPQGARDDIGTLKRREGSLSLSSLLRYVYRRFPDWATNSKLGHLGA